LDTKPLAELRDDHKHNFAIHAESIDEAEIVPASFWFRLCYSGVSPVGLLRLRSHDGSRRTLALTTKDDVRRALELLPGQLGAKLRVGLSWDAGRSKFVGCPFSEDFAVPTAEETGGIPFPPPAPANIKAGPPSARGPGPISLEEDYEAGDGSQSPPVSVALRPRSSGLVLVVCLVAAGLILAGSIAVVWLNRKPAPIVPAPIVEVDAGKVPRLPEAELIPEPWWRPFSSLEGNFQISFPGEPLHQEKDIAFLVGTVRRFAYFKGFPRPEVSFWADYLDLNPQLARQCPPDRCFQWVQDRMVAQFPDGKVLLEKAIRLGPHFGRDCLIVGAEKEVAARMFTIPVGRNTRLFFLMVQGKRVRAAASDVTRFFDSFRFLEPQGERLRVAQVITAYSVVPPGNGPTAWLHALVAVRVGAHNAFPQKEP
jgi:hypothetical protein